MLTVTEAQAISPQLLRRARKSPSGSVRWVFHDVLPQIRRTGSYSLPGTDPKHPPASPPNGGSSDHELNVQEQLVVIDYIFEGFGKAGVELKLVESAKFSALAAQFPSMVPAFVAAKESLMLETPDNGHWYNPTKLGEMLAVRLGLPQPIFSRKMNTALETVGFQVPEHGVDSKGRKTLTWHLTPSGEAYGCVFLESAQGHNKTVSVIRWLPQVLDEISQLFVNM